MNKTFVHIEALVKKHKLALANNSKDVRLTIAELTDIVADINSLLLILAKNSDNLTDITKALQKVSSQLELLIDDSTDGGNF